MKNRYLIYVVLLVQPIFAAIAPGWAQSSICETPRLLASLALQSAGFGNMGVTVPVTINGVSKQLVLDTGGALTQLSRKTIDELSLPVRSSTGAVYDVDGRTSRQFTVVNDFIFGSLHRSNAAFLVAPDRALPFAGEIAQDMLSSYDVNIDFAKGILQLFVKDHCPGVLGIDSNGFSRLAMSNKGWHLHVEVRLDGHVYDAIFDTGSRHTIMRSFIADRDFSLSAQSSDMVPFTAINGDPFLNGYLHKFSKLSLGNVTIEEPTILIMPDIMSRNADRSPIAHNRTLLHNAGLKLPELSLGMDVLSQLHLYLAFGENALYIVPVKTMTLQTDKP